MPKCKCEKCGRTFDRDNTKYIIIPHGKVKRYAHEECPPIDESDIETQLALQKQNLKDYIQKTLSAEKCNWPLITKEIAKYLKDGYTPINIQHTIMYCQIQEPKAIMTANGHIAFIPFYYTKAVEYFKKVNAAKLKNAKTTDYKISEYIITIAAPASKKNLKLFDLGE